MYLLLTCPATNRQYPKGAAGGAVHRDGDVLGGGGEHLVFFEDSISSQSTGTSFYLIRPSW